MGRFAGLVASLVALAVVPNVARARATGIAASSCSGCHNETAMPGTLALSATPTTFAPGQRVELSLSLTGPYADGGAYISTAGVGDLEIIAGEGLRKVSSGLVHERPKPASGGAVQFRFVWTAPATAGAVRFAIEALGGNGNDQSSGDAPASGEFDFVYGCEAKTYYFDADGDGAGRADTPQLACAGTAPAMFAPNDSDCDDYNEDVYPGAPEQCNQRDDDCNGQIDENVVPVELWPDADGDGYYDARSEKVGTPMLGCAGLKGWAALPGDCQPMNPAINPRAQEICNNLDDDCDGDIDERVRPTCGEGWCRRESASCDLSFCRPGTPEKETCNFLDDDCDGEIDEDAELCTLGQVCDGGECVGALSSGGSASTPTGGAGTGSSPEAKSGGCALGARHAERGLLLVACMLWGAALLRRRLARAS